MPRRNCVKTKKELEESIKDTITRYEKIIFSSETPTCMACLDEPQRQQVIDQKIYDQKLMEDYGEKTRMGGASKKYCKGW